MTRAEIDNAIREAVALASGGFVDMRDAPGWRELAVWDAACEACAKACEPKVKREAGFGGQWEGYGPSMQHMDGRECAEACRSLKWEQE